MIRLLVIVLLSVVLSACAAGLSRKDEGMQFRYVDYAGDPVERITVMRGVDYWTSISRTQLVIWTRMNEAWLLTVWDSCTELQFAQAISVTQTGNSISRFEKVRVGNEECPITEIRPIDVKQMRADRKAAAGKEP
jgi:hypothetical protein